MLGIRRYQGTQIDLFVGDPETFVCDRRMTVGAHLTELMLTADAPHPHLALFAPEPGKAHALMAELKAALDGAPSRPRRVTWILEDLSDYEMFQEALFATFPEAPFGSKVSE